MRYVELQVTSNFSFLRGASHPEELVEQAAAYGYKEIAITDRNSLAGIVRAHAAARKFGLKVIPGCRLDLLDGPSLLAYPTNMKSYSLLCNLLSTGNLRAEKGDCHLYKADVYEHAKEMLFVVLPPTILNEEFDFEESFKQNLQEYKGRLGDQLYLSTCRYYNGDDAKYLYRLAQLSTQFNIPIVATNDVHYHHLQRRELHDIVTCIREKCTIYNAGFRLHANAERYLKPEEEMFRLFRHYPEAIRHAEEIAEATRAFLLQMQQK